MSIQTLTPAGFFARRANANEERPEVRGRRISGASILPIHRVLLCVLVAIPAGSSLLAWTGKPSLVAFWGLLCLLLGFTSALLLWVQQEAIPTNPVLLACAAVPLIGAAQLCFAQQAYRFATEQATLQWVAMAALLFSGLWALQSTAKREFLLSGLLLFGLAATVAEVIQIFGYERYRTMSSGLPLLSSNGYAELMELLLPIALTRAFGRPKQTVYYAMFATLIVATVFGSGARAGSVLVTLEVAVLFWWNVRRNISSNVHFKFIVLLFPLLLSGLVLLEGPHTLITRLRESDPLAGRREIGHASVQMFKENWKSGTGLGTFQYVYPAYATFDNGYAINSAHNDWLELGLEGGIAVPIILLAGLLTLAGKAWRSGWGLGILCLPLHAAVDFPLHRVGVLTTLIVLVAALAAAKRSVPNPPSTDRRSLEAIPRIT